MAVEDEKKVRYTDKDGKILHFYCSNKIKRVRSKTK